MDKVIEIIQLSPEDWEKYKELRLRALSEDPQAFGESYENASTKPVKYWQDILTQALEGESWSVFAKVDNKLVGMLQAAIHSDDPESVWLHATYVDKNYRGMGVSKKLLEGILKKILISNAPRIVKLGVNKDLLPAVNLYKKFGFEMTAEDPYVMGNGESVVTVMMEKHL